MFTEQVVQDQQHRLYVLVSDARESCAGCNVKDKKEVVQKIADALRYAEMLQLPEEDLTVQTLTRALAGMKKARNYGERLPVDWMLCDVLNHYLRDR